MNINLPIQFDMIVDVVFEDDSYVAASTYKGLYVPDGDIISGDKDAELPPEVVADYNAFIVSVEDLCIDYYGLELTYLNFSDDLSNYYNFLAKDEYGNPILKFRLRLRVSNHPAHRTKLQQQNKKAEESSEELLRFTHGKKLKKYSVDFVVNDKTKYESYMDAFVALDNLISRAIEVITR